MDAVLRSRIASRVQAGADEAETTFRVLGDHSGIASGETAVGLFFSDRSRWVEGSSSAPFLSALLEEWIDVTEDRLPQAGTILLSNDPYDGGGTLCDVLAVSAVPVDSDVCWVAAAGHYPDLGGRTVGGIAPAARSIHEEGVRVSLAEANGGLLDLMSANARDPETVRNSLEAQIQCLGVFQDWLLGLGETHGWETVESAGRETQERARLALRQARQDLAHGTTVRLDRLDDDIHPRKTRSMRVELSIIDGLSTVDFEGTDPCSSGPTNCPISATRAGVRVGYRHLFPEVPACGFSEEGLEIRVPHGSLLDACFPTAVSGTADVLSDRVISLTIEAFSKAVQGRGRACDGGGGNVVAFEGYGEKGVSGTSISVGSGGGASGRGDGLSNTDAPGRFSAFPSVESIERSAPVRVIRYETRTGSGGAGRYRGGDGTILELECLEPGMRVSVYGDRGKRGAAGHHRGSRGDTSQISLFKEGHWQTFDPAGRLQDIALETGDRVRIETAGGGGYGHPYERAIRLLTEDVRAGRMSRKTAAKEHGVVYTSNDARDYDSAKTFKLRSYRLTSSDVDDFLDEIETLEG